MGYYEGIGNNICVSCNTGTNGNTSGSDNGSGRL